MPNLAVDMFTYTDIAGVFAPVAVIGHVLVMRWSRSLDNRKRPDANAEQRKNGNAAPTEVILTIVAEPTAQVPKSPRCS